MTGTCNANPDDETLSPDFHSLSADQESFEESWSLAGGEGCDRSQPTVLPLVKCLNEDYGDCSKIMGPEFAKVINCFIPKEGYLLDVTH